MALIAGWHGYIIIFSFNAFVDKNCFLCDFWSVLAFHNFIKLK